jgi:hypothetical protein
MSIIQGTSKAAGGAVYEIDQSIRFNNDDTAYMTRTPASAGNTKLWTLSLWFKRCSVSETQVLFAAATSGLNEIRFSSTSNTIYYDWSSAGVFPETTAVLRDTSAWYHLVTVYDTDNATAADRLQCYLNGTRLTLSATLASGTVSKINSNVIHALGISSYSIPSFYPWDGYLAEVNFIDGTALAPTDFGETNSDGVWVPKEYTNAAGYGTNGFYITGADSADLGADDSGNGNDFTSSGLTSADQITGDTPTTNACVMSPIDQYGSTLNLADGNLRCTPSTSSYCSAHGTFYVSSGKWVIECKHTTVFGEGIGFGQNGQRISGSSHRGFGMFADGRKFVNTTYTATGTGLASGDYRYCFLDLDNNAMWFAHVDVSSSDALVYDNGATKAEIEAGTTTNAVHTSLPAGDYAPTVWMDTSGVIEMNFGQSAFYTSSDLPEGFKALSTANLPTPSITDGSAYFQPTLYTGTGSSLAVTQSGNSTFQPDWVWTKGRSGATEHVLTDAVRGVTKELSSNDTGAEETVAQGLTAFDSAGFTVGTDGSYNTSSATYVGWQWKANGAGSSNTDGSITSTVSANTTAGFSIVTYVGNSTSGATVGHGLGAVPKMMILKDRDVGENWCIYHDALGPTKFLFFTTDAAFTVSNRWNDTAPTSSVFTLGNETQVNATGRDYVVYCFAEVPGYSSFGSYTGNGSNDGPFTFTNGMTPKWVMIKRTNSTGNWDILDTTREPFNSVGNQIFANTSAAEASNDHEMDFLSNGIKIRDTSTSVNASGSTYIYMAFAEHPFGGDGVAPATAR